MLYNTQADDHKKLGLISRIFVTAILILVPCLALSQSLKSAQRSCTDQVRSIVWGKVIKYPSYSDDLTCESLLQVEPVRLGKDQGYLVRGYGEQLCNPTGNCDTWLVRRKANAYKIILDMPS